MQNREQQQNNLSKIGAAKVMTKEKATDRDPEECGLVLTAEIDGYRIYEDPVTAETVKGWQKYYEEEE